MRPIQLLIKPVSGSCNLCCEYCFYEDVSKHRVEVSKGKMTFETLETLIRETFTYAQQRVGFSFQGGEPMLAGLNFYRHYIEMIEKYNINQLPVDHGIQTNGTHIDDEWATFFSDHRFLVGLSLDGTRGNHDRYRVDAKGEGSFTQVWSKVDILKRHQVEFNILTVITAQTAQRARSIYDFYRSKGLLYQQYIPCLNPLGEADKTFEFTLTPELYGEFLCELFDCWYKDVMAGHFIYLSYFENLVGMLRGIPPGTCGMIGVCTPQLVVEADGSFYPCDFYVLDKYRMGSIHEQSLAELDAERLSGKFLEESRPQAEECVVCDYLHICRGGCRRHRESACGSEVIGLNHFCDAYKKFFKYALPRLTQLARRM